MRCMQVCMRCTRSSCVWYTAYPCMLRCMLCTVGCVYSYIVYVQILLAWECMDAVYRVAWYNVLYIYAILTCMCYSWECMQVYTSQEMVWGVCIHTHTYTCCIVYAVRCRHTYDTMWDTVHSIHHSLIHSIHENALHGDDACIAMQHVMYSALHHCTEDSVCVFIHIHIHAVLCMLYVVSYHTMPCRCSDHRYS